VEKNTETSENLKKELMKNPTYLEEIGGFDEADIIEIKVALKVVLSTQMLTEVKDKPELYPRSKPWFSYAVPIGRLVVLSLLIMTILNYYSRGNEIAVPFQSHSNNVSSFSWDSAGNTIGTEGEKDLFSVVATSAAGVISRNSTRKDVFISVRDILTL
jgi:hypothetical protein